MSKRRFWLRRLFIGVALFLWFALLLTPLVAFRLATNGEIGVGQEGGRQVRFFLLQEKETEGIGMQVSRPQADNPTCMMTTVRYFMWRGEGENNQFCICQDGRNCRPSE